MIRLRRQKLRFKQLALQPQSSVHKISTKQDSLISFRGNAVAFWSFDRSSLASKLSKTHQLPRVLVKTQEAVAELTEKLLTGTLNRSATLRVPLGYHSQTFYNPILVIYTVEKT